MAVTNVALEAAKEAQTIGAIGHIMLLPLKSEWPDLAKFKFGDPSTYGSALWLGDTSAENLPEFEADGGDVLSKRTWDRKHQRHIRETKTYTGTFNQVAVTREFLEATQSGGDWNEDTKSWTQKGDTAAREWMLLIIVEDGEYVSGLGFYKVSLLSDFQNFSVEEFQETPVSIAVSTDDEGRMVERFLPRRKTQG